MNLRDAKGWLKNGGDPDARLGSGMVLHEPYCTQSVVRYLASMGADFNAVYVRGADTATPLQTCARGFAGLRIYLEYGADPTLHANYGPDEMRKMKRWIECRNRVMVLLLSIPGLSKGLALTVGKWVLRTH